MNRFFTYSLVFFLIPITVFGASIVRTGEMVSITEDQVVQDDFYGFGNDVAISGEVEGDLLGASGDMTLNGKVGADFLAVAGKVNIHGGSVVGDDVRVVAGEVTVAGEIVGDLVVVAGNLKVLSTAKVGGDIMFFGSEADIAGEVGGNVLGNSDQIRIDGLVEGEVDIKTSALTLGEKADIEGVVKYTSATDLVRAQDSEVAGKIVRNDPILEEVSLVQLVLIPFLITLFTALVGYLFLRRFLTQTASQAYDHPLRSILIGFGVLFLVPIVSIILIASTLGMLLGFILLFTYVALLASSFVTAGVVAGSYIAKMTPRSGEVPILFVALGVLFVHALMFVPIVGFLVLVTLILISLGALATRLYRLIR